MTNPLQTKSSPSNTIEEPARSWLDGGIAILDSTGKIVDINEPFAHWIGKARAELVGDLLWDRLAQFQPEWSSVLVHLKQNSGSFARMDLKWPGQPARWFNVELARASEAVFLRMNSIVPPGEDLAGGPPPRDSEVFARLLRAETRLNELTRTWPGVLLSQRPDFGMLYASPNIKQLTGRDASEWCGQTVHFWNAVHEADANDLRQQFKHAVKSNSPIANTFRIRNAMTGRVVHILEHRQPVISPHGLLLGYEAAWLDVTRQTIAERRLSAAAWKETLAVLTLGMAHDFTNVIAGIHSLSESFLSQVDGRHPFYEGLSLIKKSSLQASQLVQRMVNLHSGQVGERNYYNLNEVASDIVELVKKIFSRRIQLDTAFNGFQLPVYIDLVEFRQVVINLLLNAADSMPHGGSLTITTSRHEQWPLLQHVKGVAPRLPCVCLAIQDTGCGVKERHLESIFDPFFTTKAKGSGLGLYNARLAMEKLQGAISVVSKESMGSTFQLWLPEADFSEAQRAEDSAQRKRQTRRSLLLVGLPGEMFDKTAELFRSHNYHIVTAGAADGLAELLQSSDYQFDGVLLLAEPNDRMLATVPSDIRQQNKKVKLILKMAGCNEEDLETQFLNGLDLVLNADLAEADMLLKLKTFFEQTD